MANFWQTWRDSFSAVSKPNFAIKHSSESYWRDLQDLHAFAPLESNRKTMKSAFAPLSIQNFSQISSHVFAFFIICIFNFFTVWNSREKLSKKITIFDEKIFGISGFFTENFSGEDQNLQESSRFSCNFAKDYFRK